MCFCKELFNSPGVGPLKSSGFHFRAVSGEIFVENKIFPPKTFSTTFHSRAGGQDLPEKEFMENQSKEKVLVVSL